MTFALISNHLPKDISKIIRNESEENWVSSLKKADEKKKRGQKLSKLCKVVLMQVDCQKHSEAKKFVTQGYKWLQKHSDSLSTKAKRRFKEIQPLYKKATDKKAAENNKPKEEKAAPSTAQAPNVQQNESPKVEPKPSPSENKPEPATAKSKLDNETIEEPEKLPIKYFIKRIKSCPAAKKLYDEAAQVQLERAREEKMRSPTINIKFMKVKKHTFIAKTQPYDGYLRVEVAPGDTKDSVLTWIIFELANFKRSREFGGLLQSALYGRIKDADEYAKEKERIEFETVKEHYNIISEAIKTNQWSCAMLRNESVVLLSFDQYWEQIKNSEHTNIYRAEFLESREKYLERLKAFSTSS